MPQNANAPNRRWEFKSIRDPLYGFIGLTRKETDLVSSTAFQRLISLKQLSHAYVVYPSAMHTRFEHSLGALHIADRIAQNLGFDEERRTKIRIAALLHDLGHGPFSHLFEQALERWNNDFSHENVTRWIIEEDSEINSILGARLSRQVLDVLPHNPREPSDTLCADIISSGVDADKLDYLRRDSYHVGVAYGSFDLERIIHTVDVTPRGQNLCIQEKGKDAIENYRLGRYLMHAQVYEHHARIIADQMFLRAVELALSSGILDRSILTTVNSRSGSKARRRFLQYYHSLTDDSVYNVILRRKSNKAASFLKDIKERRLFKRACELDLAWDIGNADDRKRLSSMSLQEMKEKERRIARGVGLDPSDVIIHRSSISIKLYEPYDILILRRNGDVKTLDEMSPISAETRPIERLFIFCPMGKRHEVRQAARQHLEF